MVWKCWARQISGGPASRAAEATEVGNGTREGVTRFRLFLTLINDALAWAPLRSGRAEPPEGREMPAVFDG